MVDESEERDKNRGCLICARCALLVSNCRRGEAQKIAEKGTELLPKRSGKSRQQTVRRVSARNSQAFKIPEA